MWVVHVGGRTWKKWQHSQIWQKIGKKGTNKQCCIGIKLAQFFSMNGYYDDEKSEQDGGKITNF